MKINISKQILFFLTLAVSLLTFVLLFAFLVLVPEGKDYRIKRAEVSKQNLELRQLENFALDTKEHLQKLRSDNRHIITAFDAKFNLQRFEKQYKSYFSSLSLSKAIKVEDNQGFIVYDVNTTSSINSPQSFYKFLDAVNKSDWIIEVSFPINFKREAEIIRSSFSMKVYNNSKDTNTTSAK